MTTAAPGTGEVDYAEEGRPLILVVDDDEAVAYTLADTLRMEFEVIAITNAEAALPALEQRQVAVVIADQRMPARDGVELLIEARRRRPEVIGVLITAFAELDTAMQAINEARAFAYLTKPWETDELMATVRRAVDAHRALLRQRGQLRDQQRREIRVLEKLSRSSPAPVTAQRFGAAPLRQRSPDTFAELVPRYAAALEHAVEQRIYRVDHHLSEELRDLADHLGAMRAGPRDVVELHTTALKQRLPTAGIEEAEAYSEEGRLLVLELMGNLVSYYRVYTVGLSE